MINMHISMVSSCINCASCFESNSRAAAQLLITRTIPERSTSPYAFFPILIPSYTFPILTYPYLVITKHIQAHPSTLCLRDRSQVSKMMSPHHLAPRSLSPMNRLLGRCQGHPCRAIITITILSKFFVFSKVALESISKVS